MGQLRTLNMPLTWSCHWSPRWGSPSAISTAGCSHGNSRRRSSTSWYICSALDKHINDGSPYSISKLPNCTSNLQDAESRNTWVSSTNDLVAQYQVPGARRRGRRQATLTRCSRRAIPSQYQRLRVRVQRPGRRGRLRIHTTLYSRQIARKFDTHPSITSDSDSDAQPILTKARCRLTYTMAYAWIENLRIVAEPAGSAIALVSWLWRRPPL